MRRTYLIVIFVWAAIYLPRLGSLELKSEEGRRVLPAVTMLETGNYLVPEVGSEPYFRKPPLVNWLVAASFKIFGARNEWTARLPSVLCMLVVALAFLSVAGSALGPNGSLAAALMWLTNFGLLEKGRMIEIEALYVSLTALAFVFWLSWWREPQRQWLPWTVPWIFLGLALLAKGPLSLLFFYAVLIAVLASAGELRQLFRGPHLIGILIMLAIFSAWAIPCLLVSQAGHVASVWSRQFSGRVSGENFHFGNWLLNIPRGLVYLLPWAALLPFARFRLLEKSEERSFCRALSLGIAVPFLFVSLLPGALPRYNMPLLAPAIWLLAILIRDHALVWPIPLRKAITWTVVAIVCGMLIYSLAIIPFLKRREKIRPIAVRLEKAIPPNEKLYAIDPEYQPYLFYLHRKIIYLSAVSELPPGAHYVLVRPAMEKQVPGAQPFLRIRDYRGNRVVLLRLGKS